jgi:hypothetical protein
LVAADLGSYDDPETADTLDESLPAGIEAMAGGGSVKIDGSKDSPAFSFAGMSVEDAGVGGRCGRGI